MFRVSVIIPAYNAGHYIEVAIRSALDQPETAEVIVVDDGSTDNTFEFCNRLAVSENRLRVLCHPNHANLKPAATRNLGMRSATSEWIAFLDADDRYLPGRFSTTATVAKQCPDADAIYEASELVFENEEARKLYEKIRGKDYSTPSSRLYTVSEAIHPERFFYYYITGTKGYFNVNSFCFKKSLLEKAGYMVDIRLHQDVEFFTRLAYYGRFYAGNITKAVSQARIHATNSTRNISAHSKLLQIDHTYKFLLSRSVPGIIMWHVLKRMLIIKARANGIKSPIKYLAYIGYLAKEMFSHPLLLFKVIRK